MKTFTIVFICLAVAFYILVGWLFCPSANASADTHLIDNGTILVSCTNVDKDTTISECQAKWREVCPYGGKVLELQGIVNDDKTATLNTLITCNSPTKSLQGSI